MQEASGCTVTFLVVENSLRLDFSQAVRFVDGPDSIWKRLGFSPELSDSFTLTKQQHISYNPFNLSQTPVIYMQILNCGFSGDIIQNQHFAIPVSSPYGAYIQYIAQKLDDQQTISGEPIVLNYMKFKLYDFDGHQLHTGFENDSNMPLTMVLDVE